MKTREEMADEALEQEVHEKGQGFLSRPFNRYRFHNGFIAGHASRDAELAAKDLRIERLEEALRKSELVYTHAVKGRQDFRKAFKEQRERANELKAFLTKLEAECGPYFECCVVGRDEIRQALSEDKPNE